MRIKMSFIPSLFTVFNMFAGFLAIVQIFNARYESAIWLIIIAAVFDGMDGKIARFTHNESPFGVEFDSLSDIISFCLAPSIMVYTLYTQDMHFTGAMIAFMPLLFGGIRLARFNVQAQQKGRKKYYTGLPVPGMAMTIITYVLFNIKTFGHYGNPRIILPLMTVLSFLMVSKVRFPAMPAFSFKRGKKNNIKMAFLILALSGALIFDGYFMFPFILCYLTYNIVRWMIGYQEIEEISQISN